MRRTVLALSPRSGSPRRTLRCRPWSLGRGAGLRVPGLCSRCSGALPLEHKPASLCPHACAESVHALTAAGRCTRLSSGRSAACFGLKRSRRVNKANAVRGPRAFKSSYGKRASAQDVECSGHSLKLDPPCSRHQRIPRRRRSSTRHLFFEHRFTLMADKQVVHIVRVFFLLGQDSLEHDASGRVLVAEVAHHVAVRLDADAALRPDSP